MTQIENIANLECVSDIVIEKEPKQFSSKELLLMDELRDSINDNKKNINSNEKSIRELNKQFDSKVKSLFKTIKLKKGDDIHSITALMNLIVKQITMIDATINAQKLIFNNNILSLKELNRALYSKIKNIKNN